MATLARYSLDGFPDWSDYGPGKKYKDIHEGFAADDAALRALMKRSETLPEGEVVGALLSFGRGDGAAYYVVTKERPLTVAWVPTSDRWTVEAALIRGLNKADVLRTLEYARLRADLFRR